MRRALAPILALAALLPLAGCPGGLPGLGGAVPKRDTGKAIIADARAELEKIKGQYVVSAALLEEADEKSKELSTIPDDINLKKFDLKKFKKALTDCFSEAGEKVAGFQDNAISLKDAATHFDLRQGINQMREVRPAIDNALGQVKSCAPTTVADAKKKLEGVQADFVDLKISEVDGLRKLLKIAIPSQAQRVVGQLAESKAKVASMEAKLMLELKNPVADQGKINAHIAGLKADSEQVLGRVQTDAEALQKRGVELVTDVTNSINKLGEQ